MAKKKNPFRGYTEEQVFAAEAATYIVQAGYNLFSVNGKFTFNKKSAIVYYNKILREMLFQLANGRKADRKNAETVLRNLHVLPLRIH